MQVSVRHRRGVNLEAPVVPESAALLLVLPEIFARGLARWEGICAGEAQVNFEAGEKAAGEVFAGAHKHTERCVITLLKAIPADH